MRRNNRGQYRVNYFERFIPVMLMIWTATAGLGFKTSRYIVEARSGDNASWVESANATTPTPTPQLQVIAPTPVIPTATPTPTEREKIENEVERIFGKHAENAKKIIKCESMWNTNAVGDKNLMTYHSGELVGDSIGLFQIRTGGRDFNRAKANGMTAEEFRNEMKDPIKNIRYAKSIFDQRGWSAWSCKSKLAL